MSNNWLSQTQEGKDQIDFYLSSQDVILIERKRSLKLLLDLFQLQFKKREGLTFLDLGCGDGKVSRVIHSLFPNNEFYLLDGSESMLAKAGEIFKGGNIHTVCSTFEEYCQSPLQEKKYDFVYSSMAIHHIEFHEKQRLFSRIFQELKFGGMFLDIDVVLPSSEKSEAWQFQMWRDWMNEIEPGKHDGLPDSYKNKGENKPSDLSDQLRLLREIGYRNADCFFKYGIFALFGGTKD